MTDGMRTLGWIALLLAGGILLAVCGLVIVNLWRRIRGCR